VVSVVVVHRATAHQSSLPLTIARDKCAVKPVFSGLAARVRRLFVEMKVRQTVGARKYLEICHGRSKLAQRLKRRKHVS